MSEALHAEQLSKRYGRTWALRECSLAIPEGTIAALVGPNSAGKTTLLHLAVGLLQPTSGTIAIFGHSPVEQPQAALNRTGFVAQDHPLYRGFTVAEMLHTCRLLNARWDEAFARTRLDQIGISLNKRIGQLSGGQHVQVALVLALARLCPGSPPIHGRGIAALKKEISSPAPGSFVVNPLSIADGEGVGGGAKRRLNRSMPMDRASARAR
jgi:ABC-2 type transport system ATP-binding protein